MKYRVECGSLVTVLRQLTYTVNAKSQEEAKEKATDRFIKDCHNAKRYIDVGGTVMIDDIQEMK